MRILTVCLFCLFFYYSSLGQSRYNVNHFTTENGLPSNGIKALQWDDSTGFLWIATEAGVVRYNGMDFKTFDVKTNPDLGSNRIVFLQKNNEGKLFAGGEKGSLLMVKANNLVTIIKGKSTAQHNYNYYGAIAASDTLFRQSFKMPWRLDIFPFYATYVASLNDTACIVLGIDKLYYYSVSTTRPVPVATAPAGIKIIFKIKGQLYCLDTAGKLFLFDVYNNIYKEINLKDTDGNNFIIKHADNNLFWTEGTDEPVLIQDGKAWVIEGNGQQLQCRQVASGIPENTLFEHAQYKKNSNSLFLGSASKGLYIFHQDQLITKQPNNTAPDIINSFYGQIELPDGNIMTNEGIIIGDAVHRNYNIGNGFLNNIFSLNDSTLIYAEGDSVFSYNKNSYNKKVLFTTDINENFSMAFSGGHLYFADLEGIGIMNKNGSIDFIKNFDKKAPVLLNGVYNMLEIAPGKLALATCEGLFQFDTQTKNIDTLLKLPSICIRSLYRYGDYTFIGTYGGGYYVMKNGLLKAMPLDVNGYLKYTHCFIKDDYGFCWISTNNGLFKVKLSDIIDAYEKDIPQIYYHYLGKDDGMETTEMNGGCYPCAIRLKNNYFSFPTMDGLVWFNPSKVNIELPSGKIYIDKIIADTEQINTTGNTPIILKENLKKLDITLVVNAWCKRENLYVDYKLNDGQWFPVDMALDQSKISFSNLSYGKYVLLIRKINGFGINNYSYRTIDFTIATPFYQQWWFRILIVILLLGITYLVFKLRLRQYALRERKLTAMIEQKTMDLNLKNVELERNNKIKSRLISIINHDIMTPLKFMHYAGKALVENKEAIKEEERFETIAEIAQAAKDMEQLSSQILNWIIYQNPDRRMQKEDFDLHQLTEMVFRVLQFSAKEKNTVLQNDIAVNFIVCQYLEPMRVMIYNLIVNSLNFTRNGVISVNCHANNDRIILQIKDSGLGMSAEQINNLLSDEKIISSVNVDNKKGTGLGYLIIKDLLNMMEGSIDIKSIKDRETIVSVSLPLA